MTAHYVRKEIKMITREELKVLWDKYIKAREVADKLRAEWGKKNKEYTNDMEISKEFSRRQNEERTQRNKRKK